MEAPLSEMLPMPSSSEKLSNGGINAFVRLTVKKYSCRYDDHKSLPSCQILAAIKGILQSCPGFCGTHLISRGRHKWNPNRHEQFSGNFFCSPLQDNFCFQSKSERPLLTLKGLLESSWTHCKGKGIICNTFRCSKPLSEVNIQGFSKIAPGQKKEKVR